MMMIIIITGVFSVNNNNEMIHGVTDAPCILLVKSLLSFLTNYRISGFFRGVHFLRISRFRKNYTQKTKILYDSHLIFDQFAKI